MRSQTPSSNGHILAPNKKWRQKKAPNKMGHFDAFFWGAAMTSKMAESLWNFERNTLRVQHSRDLCLLCVFSFEQKGAKLSSAGDFHVI